MSSRSKPRPAPGRRGQLAGLLGLLALAATACNQDVSSIGVGLPSAQANTGAYLIDTLTIRASTVLRDSVVTSGSDCLLVGRTTDPLLGTLTAKSFFGLGLPDDFRPDASFAYDSVTLVLNPDGYRYGDTTQTQALVEVHRLGAPLPATRPLFASPRLTRLSYDSVAVLNRGGQAPLRRARPGLRTLRLRLSDAFGRDLLAQGQAGRLGTQAALDAYLPGLALTPAATDNAALLRLGATTATSALVLYYHDPTDAATVLSASFTLAGGGRHCFQVRADRRSGGATGLPTAPLQATDANLTAQQTFVEGALGLQTRLEFPYLNDLLAYGANLIITSAELTAQVPPATLSPYVPAPPTLAVSFSDALNHPVSTYTSSVPYVNGVSTLTGLAQGTYTWSVASYVQAVLAHTIPNNGLLLAAATPELPSRVVLGGPRNSAHRLQLRLYFIQ